MEHRRRKEFEHYREGHALSRRLLALRAGAALTFLGVLLGLWYLQVQNGEEYRRMAEANRLRRVFVPPQRGMMYDRKGRVVVGNRVAFTIVLDREKPYDAETLSAALAVPLQVPVADLRERIDRYRGRPAYEGAVLKEDVAIADVAFVESHRVEFPNLQIQTEPRRDYLNGLMTAHVVGYVGEVSEGQLKADQTLMMGDTVGRAGVEKALDTRLRGARGEQLVEVNALGRPLGEASMGRQPVAGDDAWLTLDMDLQRTLAEALGDETGAGVFLDPRSGEILAMVSTPTFDPNRFSRHFTREEWQGLIGNEKRPLQNRAIAGLYSAGSTFKLLMALAALEAGVIDENTAIHCGGAATFYGHPFHCWKKGGHGTISLNSAIAQSCNIYFYTVGARLGIDRIAQAATRMGFGEKTGIDLLGEEAGLVPSPAWKMATLKEQWYAGETISVSIGQGPTQVTVLQMANFAAMLATGGTAYRPQIVRPGKGQLVVGQQIRTAAMDPHALAVVRHAMQNVVEAGTGGQVRLPGITVVGKTGTVQVTKASSGVDSDKLPKEQRDHGWFIGYAPMEDPTIAFAVLVEHGGHGGTISAPIVRKVLEVYFGIPPRPEPKPLPKPEEDRIQLARAPVPR